MNVFLSTGIVAGLMLVALPSPKSEAHTGSNICSRLIKAHYKSLGKQRARASWRHRARKAYGWRHRKWSNAKNRYYHENYYVGSWYRWRIRACGRPSH
jgi:hypothetical protein